MLSFSQLRWCYYVNSVEISKVLHDIENEDKQNLFTTDRIGNISLYLKKTTFCDWGMEYHFTKSHMIANDVLILIEIEQFDS